MKLTPHTIRHAPNVISPEGRLTLVLRDNNIAYIENLASSGDVYAAVDLSNNDIAEVAGLGGLPTLHTVLLANNRITRVAQGERCAVRALLLAQNRLASFSALAQLRQFPQLENLLMVGNPVTAQEQYRVHVVLLVPLLRVLDGEKVTLEERRAAERYQEAKTNAEKETETEKGEAEAETKGEAKIETVAEKDTVEADKTETKTGGLSAEEKAKLVQQLEAALSMEEVERISALLGRSS